MEFEEEETELISSFRSSLGIAPSQGRFVEVIDESSVLYTSGTSLVLHNSAINKSDFIRNDSSWFRILASAVNAQKQYCAVVVLSGKPTIPRVRRASVIERRGSVFAFGGPPTSSGEGEGEGSGAGTSSGKPRAASAKGRGPGTGKQMFVPVAVALAHLPSMQIAGQVQLAKSYFLDPTTICFAAFSQDGKVIAVGNKEPENKVIVIDPRTGELLFTFNNDQTMISLVFTVEKRFKQSEVYALLVLSANKLQSYKQEDKRTTFTVSKLIAQNKVGKFTCLSDCIKSEYFAIGSKDGYLGFYSYSSLGKGNKELTKLSLGGRTPYCATSCRNGSYLLCGCDGGTVLIFEDYHSIVAGERKNRAKLGQSDEINISFKLKCSVKIGPIATSPVARILLDISTSTTIMVGERNQIASYSTQLILSGRVSSSTFENDYGEISDIQRELSSELEKANQVCSSHFGNIVSMDTCVVRGLIATCATDNTVRIWNIENFDCEVVSNFPSKEDIENGFNVELQSQTNLGPPEYVTFHPQGYHVAICHDEALSIFYILHNRLELAHTFPVSHCFKAFISRGGNLIAAISGNNIEVFQFFPPYTHFATLKGHLGSVSNLCWSSDDLSIASTCVRGSVVQWDMNPSYKTKAERIERSKSEEYIKKIDSFIDVAIDDVEPILKERSIVVVSFDGSLQFITNGNVQHRLASKALDGDRATVVCMSSVTMHYESNLTKDLRMVDEFFKKNNVIDMPKIGVLLVGTNAGNIIAFTNWRKLERNPNSREALPESLMPRTQRHIFPRCHSEPIVAISTMESETNKYNTVVSCCTNGNICVSYMALQEGMDEDMTYADSSLKAKLFKDTENMSNFVLVPHTLIKNFDSEIKGFKLKVEELTTEVDYQRERSAKQQRDTLKVFAEKETNLVTEYKSKTVDLEQALERAGKTADVKVKELGVQQDEVLKKMESNFETKLQRELEISHDLRQDAEMMALNHEKEVKNLKISYEARYDAMKAKMDAKVAQLEEEKAKLYQSKVESERNAEEFLLETETNYDDDLEMELMRTSNLEKDMRQKIHDSNLEARMHKRSYDQLVEKIEREKKEEHDHAAEKDNLRKKIEDLENECVKFEDLIVEREEQLVEKEKQNEELQRSNKEMEKQIFLHQELERDMKERFEPIKERLEVMDERIVLQDNEVEKQFNKLRGQKVQIEDKDTLIRTLRSELNKEMDRARILSAKLEDMEHRVESQNDVKLSTVQKSKQRNRRPRPASSPVYRTASKKPLSKQTNFVMMDDDQADNARLCSEIQRQRSAMEKASNNLLKRSTFFEEKVAEVSEQRMVENRELLDENIRLRKRLKETQWQLQSYEAIALQKGKQSSVKDPEVDGRSLPGQRQRPKSAMAFSGQLVRGSCSRLIKSVSVADKQKISNLMGELQVTKLKSKEQNEEISRLRNMVNTYRDEKIIGSRTIRPSSAPPKRRWK